MEPAYVKLAPFRKQWEKMKLFTFHGKNWTRSDPVMDIWDGCVLFLFTFVFYLASHATILLKFPTCKAGEVFTSTNLVDFPTCNA